MGELMGLSPESHVLDIGCGRGGPATILAEAFGSRVTGVERAGEFVEAANRLVENRGLSQQIQVVQVDAHNFELAPEAFDAVLCLGAAFIWGGIEGTCTAPKRPSSIRLPIEARALALDASVVERDLAVRVGRRAAPGG